MKTKGWIPWIMTLALVTVSMEAGAGTWEHTREGWMLGLSLGGDGQLDVEVVALPRIELDRRSRLHVEHLSTTYKPTGTDSSGGCVPTADPYN